MSVPVQKMNLEVAKIGSIPVAVIGNVLLLSHPKIAFLCSRKCPPDKILPAHDKARELREVGSTVMSPFQTSIEQGALKIFLRGKNPIIWCPARSLGNLYLKSPWRIPHDDGRLLILSFVPDGGGRITRQQSALRNRYMLRFANSLFVAWADPGGALSTEVEAI